MKNNNRPRRPSRLPGFSLPEVAIATAIAAVSLVTIVGLLPQGLQSVQKSSQVSNEARIVRELLGEIQLMDWGVFDGKKYKNLDSNVMATTFKFDAEGGKIPDGSNNMTDLAFVAQATYAGTRIAPQFPGAQNPNPNSIVLLIQIAPTNNPKYSFDNAPPNTYSVQTAIVTRQFYSSQQ
jgi:uncharacterized protein (TIGR02598 family)